MKQNNVILLQYPKHEPSLDMQYCERQGFFNCEPDLAMHSKDDNVNVGMKILTSWM